uniref:Uncharacterized protein LOC100372647 n=1 Tax=Saccoglossus kowalevskii TaxID=10224 RepID=A0ABM0N0N5_SACKO
MCASTRFPEAIPLRKIITRNIVRALVKFFTTFGLPRCVQSDQGTNFMSAVFRQVFQRLGITHSISSAYHPESQGVLERFHQTLKSMLRAYCLEHSHDWDEGVPYLLFAVREVVQESLGFSPFDLVCGHIVRGPLKLLKERLLEDKTPTNLLSYVSEFKTRLHQAFDMARDNLKVPQCGMKSWYDKKRDVNKQQAVVCAPAVALEPGEEVLDSHVRLKNSQVLANLNKTLHHLPLSNMIELKSLILEFRILFPDAPGRTNLVEHDVVLEEG